MFKAYVMVFLLLSTVSLAEETTPAASNDGETTLRSTGSVPPATAYSAGTLKQTSSGENLADSCPRFADCAVQGNCGIATADAPTPTTNPPGTPRKQ